MSQHDPIGDQPRRDDDGIGRAENSQDTESGELSFDDLARARPGPPDATPFVHALQERVEAALGEPSAGEAADDDAETVERWPRQVQFICIMGGSALCWAVILAPFLLF